MEINAQTRDWALKKLLVFRTWKNFPKDPAGIEVRVRAFLRLVHNKPIREILCPAGTQPVEIDWQEIGLDPEQTDVDWILDRILETCDSFPLPIEMREMYEEKLPPAMKIFR
jgi:hypothetical protein